jgi:cyclophilin family peptidyl-prolyl cis-trans isomerase
VLSGLDPDPHWSVRAQLAAVLATKDPERVLPRVMGMLSDSDGRVISEVLTALRRLKAPDTAKILLMRLGSDDAGVRSAAARNLGELKPEGAVDALAAAYKRGEADLTHTARLAALEALSTYGAAAMPTLRAALGDRDWAIRVRAADLLKRLDPTVETAQAIRPVPVGRPVSYDSGAVANPPVSPHVFIEMEKGTIEIELNVLDAPLTCDSFIALARKGFFNGLAFRRVILDFGIQGGDPTGTGEGGPGYTIRDEPNQQPFLRGVVAMARPGHDAGGSEFLIMHSPQPQLDARFTVFGRVVSGMEVVDGVAQGDVMKNVRVWDGIQ